MALQRALSWLTHQSVASDYEEFVGRGRMAASVRQNVIDRMTYQVRGLLRLHEIACDRTRSREIARDRMTYQVRGLLMPSDAFRGLRMPSEAF